jgi:hypothetical protein
VAVSLDLSAARRMQRNRAARRSAQFWGRLKPREILDERQNERGELLGPYEAEYQIANGYCDSREIEQP